MSRKRGQEEIVGFVAIVVLIAIVALVFLTFSLRTNNESESIELGQFLDSAQEYTTLCALTFVPDYARLGELFSACRESRDCIDGASACETLNETLTGLIETGLRPGVDRPLKGYEFKAYYLANLSLAQNSDSPITHLKYGNCSQRPKQHGVSEFKPSGTGAIRITIDVC